MKHNRKKIKNIMIISILFLPLFLTGCKKKIVFNSEPPIPKNEITVGEMIYYEVQKKSIENSLKLKGLCYPYEKTAVILKETGGKVLQYFIEEGQQIKAGDIIMTLDDKSMQETIYIKEKQMERYMLSYEETMQNYSMYGGSEYSYEITQINLKLQQMEMDKLYETLEAYTIKAPISGTVYDKKFLIEGKDISQYSVICYIVNNEDLIIYYIGTKAEYLKNGNIVDLSFEDDDGNIFEFKGRVILTQNDVPEGENDFQDFVAVKPLNTPEELKFDEEVTINYVYEKRENVIVIPKSLIRNIETRTPYVYILREDGQTEKREIIIGVTNAKEAEIVSGLFEGEKITE